MHKIFLEPSVPTLVSSRRDYAVIEPMINLHLTKSVVVIKLSIIAASNKLVCR